MLGRWDFGLALLICFINFQNYHYKSVDNAKLVNGYQYKSVDRTKLLNSFAFDRPMNQAVKAHLK